MTSLSTLTRLVQAFTAGTVSVARGLGLNLMVDRDNVGPGIKASGSCAAALIGVVGTDIKGSVALLTDEATFKDVIRTMSGGMIKDPCPSDGLAISALGELANMICGSALQELAKTESGRVDITPPQLFTGENLRSVPAQAQGIRYFTIPLSSGRGTANLFLVLGFQ
jgi:chemotaxis protein CheX